MSGESKTCKPRQSLRVGDRIVLPEFDNGVNTEPEQHAIVDDLGIDKHGSLRFVYATIAAKDREKLPRWDDGLREIHVDNLPAHVTLW